MFERFQESPKYEAREAICVEKPLETAWMGLKVGWGGLSGNHQGGANSVSQVGRGSAMLLACQLCGVGLRKGTMASASTFLLSESSLPSSFRSDARQFISYPNVPGAFQSAAPVPQLRGC